MKPYFIGQGTGIVKDFDTLEEMLEYHSKMEDLDKHFCKLYDREHNKMADGNDILFNRGWREWETIKTLKPINANDLCSYFHDDLDITVSHLLLARLFDNITKEGFVIAQSDLTHGWYDELLAYEEFASVVDYYLRISFADLYSSKMLSEEDEQKMLKKIFNTLSENQLSIFKLKEGGKTYRQKAITMMQSALGIDVSNAAAIIGLIIEKGNYKPCIFPLLGAPESLENWNEVKEINI